MNYIAYYRVSTEKQGQSGLGLEAQRKSVTSYVNSIDGNLLGEFTDVESGGNDDRRNLKKAILLAKETGSSIVVKKLDRLSRGTKLPVILEELGIEYINCDSPHDDALIKDIHFVLAKNDRKNIRERITSALGVIKSNIEEKGYHISKSGRKIKALGNPENLGGPKAISRSVQKRKEKADNDPNNKVAVALIEVLKEDRGLSFRAIAKHLNERGIKTSRGNSFSDVQVGNLYKRYVQQSA